MYIQTYHERQSVEFPLGPKYNELLHSWDLGEVVWADRMCDGRHQLSCCHRNAFWNLYQTHNDVRGGGRKEVQIVHTKDVCMHIGVE